MNPTDEFLRHAAECERMAKFTRDPQSKATWRGMAERWHRCAEVFTRQSSAAHDNGPTNRHRKPAPAWANH